jgi:hypothetical protein
LKNTEVCYAIVEVVVKDDELYNPIKYMFITWIGPDVPPGNHLIMISSIYNFSDLLLTKIGLTKAKSAGHRKELLDFVQVKCKLSVLSNNYYSKRSLLQESISHSQ